MISGINEEGKLCLIAETDIEKYALKHWMRENIEEIKIPISDGLAISYDSRVIISLSKININVNPYE